MFGKVTSEHRRDAGCHLNFAGHRVGGVPGQLGRQPQQRAALILVAVLADMEGDDGIGVGGNDIRASGDELVMHLAHRMRRFHQRQRRPFRLPERRTHASVSYTHLTLPTISDV